MMNILARILSHGFAIAVVVILAVGYIYRGELFPGMELPAFLYPGSPAAVETEATTGNTGHQEPVAESTAAAVISEPAPAPAEESPVQSSPVVTGTAPEAAGEMQHPGEPPEAAVEEKPVSPVSASDAGAPSTPAVTVDSVQREPPVVNEDMNAGQVTSEGVASTPAETDGLVTEATAEPPPAGASESDTEGQTAVNDDTGEPSSPAPAMAATTEGITEPAADTGSRPEGGGNKKPYQLLASAREAFWMHNYTKAEGNYRVLIALEPDNPDGYGELGNMYFTQGDWEQAAKAYFKAGKLLVQAGRIQQAELLVQVIKGLNGSQADELETLVNASSETNR